MFLMWPVAAIMWCETYVQRFLTIRSTWTWIDFVISTILIALFSDSCSSTTWQLTWLFIISTIKQWLIHLIITLLVEFENFNSCDVFANIVVVKWLLIISHEWLIVHHRLIMIIFFIFTLTILNEAFLAFILDSRALVLLMWRSTIPAFMRRTSIGSLLMIHVVNVLLIRLLIIRIAIVHIWMLFIGLMFMLWAWIRPTTWFVSLLMRTMMLTMIITWTIFWARMLVFMWVFLTLTMRSSNIGIIDKTWMIHL